MQAIKTLVIGHGLSATVFHLPFLQSLPEFELVAISSSQLLTDRYPASVTIDANAHKLLHESPCELVVITSPNRSHVEWAYAALAAGKHVLVEKPLAISSAAAKALAAFATQQQRLLVPFHNRRFDDDFLFIQQQLQQQQRLGSIHWFESHYHRFRPVPQARWKEANVEGCGIVYDLAPHLIDQALALFGMPTTISATIKALRPSKVSDGHTAGDDMFSMVLQYPNLHVQLSSSPFCAESAPRRFYVGAAKGSCEIKGFDPQEGWLRHQIPAPTRQAMLATADGESAQSLPQGDYGQFYRQLALAIRQQAPVPVPVQAAIDGLRLLELAYQSARTGQQLHI